MTRLHYVKKARKDVLNTDIKAGESYYWWKFRRGGKHTSKTPPKRSQLTQSSFYAAIYDLEDDLIENLSATNSLPDAVQEIISALQDIADECQGNLDNMPEGLQEGDTGQLLQDRISACEEAADQYESIEFDDKEDDETDEEYWDRKLEEAQIINIEMP